MSLNIARKGHVDSAYRYKMMPLVTKVEGRGNGIKTVIVNMADVAKALHVDPEYTTKFFGIELCAASRWSKEKGRAVVNGSHPQSDMQDILYRFIELMVLCPNCSLPELKDVVKKQIKADCNACGHNFVRKDNHKIVSYILKHHGNKQLAKKGGRKGDRKTKSTSSKKDTEETNEKNEQKDDNEVVRPVRKEKVEWFTDVSEEAIKERHNSEMASMIHDTTAVEEILKQAKAERKEDLASTVLKVYMASGDRTVTEVIGELRRLQVARGFDAPQKTKVLLEAIIDVNDPSTVAAQFTENAELFRAVCEDKMSTINFLGCIEELVGMLEPKLLKKTAMIIQSLYEADIATEEALLAWYDLPADASWLVNKDVAETVKAKAKPFIDWLREAEESDEEE